MRSSCPITAFGGTQDPDVSVEELSAWQHQTRDRCRVRMLDGDHFFVRTAQTRLLRAVREELETSGSEARSRSIATARTGGKHR